MPLSTWACRGDAPSTLQRFCASISAGHFFSRPLTQTSDQRLSCLQPPDDAHLLQPQRAGHEPVCLVPEWTSICLCLSGVFAQASPHILRASYSSDIGITTDTTYDFSSTCVVLALVAGRQDFQPQTSSQRQQRLFFSAAFHYIIST